MKRLSLLAISFALTVLAFVPHAHAASYNTGYISFDQLTSSTAAFDIVNLTGPNSSGDANFPVASKLSLSNLQLVVGFASGPNETFGSSYFTLSSDGLSFDGMAKSTTVGQPGGFKGAISAMLTGSFSSTSIMLFDGTSATINPTFSVLLSDPSGLTNGDSALIQANDAMSGGTTVTPEPSSFILVGTALLAFALYRFRASFGRFQKTAVTSAMFGVAACALLLLPASASAAVKLTAAAAPGSGLAGVTTVHVTATGVPSGTLGPISVSLASSCMAGAAASTTASSVKVLPANAGDLVYFLIPASLSNGNYQVSITGTAGGSSFTSSTCSSLTVTASNASLASCVPTSSIAVTVGSDVTVYVPYGYWDGSLKGLAAVNIEGSSTGVGTKISTPGIVNSCAANSAATPAQVVCTENGTGVDLVTGTSLASTLVSGANQNASFSGGVCQNCGVAVDPANSRAVLAIGHSGGSGSGLQSLNLTSNTFDTALPLKYYVSEDVSVDPINQWILSPAEDGVFDLIKFDTTNGGYVLTEYANNISGGYLDSAAEDCTTAIALASDEFTDRIYITDLSQISFPASAPGTWTAPGQYINLNDGGYAAGTSGITSAPGTNHLAAVTGEFGGSAYAILQLPSTSGSGVPNLVDYAYVSAMPNTPASRAFNAGYDPHTISAYTSPNNQKSYTVFVDYSSNTPDYLAQVDMQCVLSAPRTGTGSHTVAASTTGGRTAADSCVAYFAIPKP